MTLEQMTVFGVRGERFRIRKDSPVVRAAEPEDACDGCLRVGVKNCLACVEKGEKPNAQRSTPNAQGGEADGCLIGLVAMVLFTIGFMMAGPCAPRRIRVQWLREYPDPVCERCGKILDGTTNECLEEGNQ